MNEPLAHSPTIHWFGDAWGMGGPAPICAPGYQIPVPVGEHCTRCAREIEEGAQGVRIPRLETEEDIRAGRWGFAYYHLFCWIGDSQGPAVAAMLMDALRKAGPQVVDNNPGDDETE